MTRRAIASAIELRRAVNMAAIEPNKVRAAQKLGVAHQTYDGWLKRASRLGIAAGEVDDNPEWQRERSSLNEQVREWKEKYASVQRENFTAQNVREFIGLAKSSLPDAPAWIVKKLPAGSPGIPLTLWSDWHVGEVVFKEQVDGINEFNSEIARKRARLLVEKIIRLCFHHTVNPTYPGIVVCLGGDLISGLLHEELRETNDTTIMQQVKEAYSLVAAALVTLADHFQHVWCIGVVGNHGRSTFKPRAKNRVQDSFEWLIYQFLEARFAGDKRFAFFIPEQTDALFTVAGHRFLLTHGDSTGARGGDGIVGAIGPIVRGEKRVRDVQSLVDRDYDTALMGHYHVKVSLDNVIVNPAFKGYDEYARNMLRARPERPSQMLIFVHPDEGIVDERRIFLDGGKPKKTSAIVSWPAKG